MSSINPRTVTCQVNGDEVRLTWMEFKTLMTLMGSAGEWMSVLDIKSHVYGHDDVEDASIRNWICRIRRKIGEDLVQSDWHRRYRVV